MHLSNSFPYFGSTLLDPAKHAEHALSRNGSSRTEIKGSRRTSDDPAGIVCVTARLLPRPGEAVGVSIFSLDDESFTNVEAVTAEDVIAGNPLFSRFGVIDRRSKRTSHHIHRIQAPENSPAISISTRLCVQNMTDPRTFCRSNRTFATPNRISHSSFHRILRNRKKSKKVVNKVKWRTLSLTCRSKTFSTL